LVLIKTNDICMITASNAAKQDFMPVLRALVRAYQAFASFDAAGYQGTGLTVPQADVLFTLGNTAGLSFKEIGKSTLITKGTLTGVVDRLEDKGLVKRKVFSEDRRITKVVLTKKGTRLFEEVFPQQISYVKKRFDRLSRTELAEIKKSLHRLHAIFS